MLFYRPLSEPDVRICRIRLRIRGRLKVAWISDGRIQWPYASKGRPCLIMTANLARAVRSESNAALCRWLCVTPQTVTIWRKAPGVPMTKAIQSLRLPRLKSIFPRRGGRRGMIKSRFRRTTLVRTASLWE
jgi:hypothetical protein